MSPAVNKLLEEALLLEENDRAHLAGSLVLSPQRQPGLLKGEVGETFFEPLPEEELSRATHASPLQ